MNRLFIESTHKSDKKYSQLFKLKNPEIVEEIAVDEYENELKPMLFGIDVDTEHTETLIIGSPIVYIENGKQEIIDYYYSLEGDTFNRHSTLTALIAGGVEVYVKGVYY